MGRALTSADANQGISVRDIPDVTTRTLAQGHQHPTYNIRTAETVDFNQRQLESAVNSIRQIIMQSQVQQSMNNGTFQQPRNLSGGMTLTRINAFCDIASPIERGSLVNVNKYLYAQRADVGTNESDMLPCKGS